MVDEQLLQIETATQRAFQVSNLFWTKVSAETAVAAATTKDDEGKDINDLGVDE